MGRGSAAGGRARSWRARVRACASAGQAAPVEAGGLRLRGGAGAHEGLPEPNTWALAGWREVTRPRCDTPGCKRAIPKGGEGHPEICPVCLAALQMHHPVLLGLRVELLEATRRADMLADERDRLAAALSLAQDRAAAAEACGEKADRFERWAFEVIENLSAGVRGLGGT